jgi:hypothetical protein
MNQKRSNARFHLFREKQFMILGRRWIFAPLLAAAVAGPALLMNDSQDQASSSSMASASASLASWLQGDASTESSVMTTDGPLHEDEAQMLDPQSIAYAPGAVDFREAFRFDAKPEWLEKNWRLISTVHSLDGIQGYRVPLVTGPNPHDLTGALTYYFSEKGLCERITFYGTTADATKITQVATEDFQLKPDNKLGRGVYSTRFAWQVRSLLAIESVSQASTFAGQRRFQVSLELNNPKGVFTLSPEMSSIVQSR